MAEQITRDELRAELSEFHKDWAGFRMDVRTELSAIRVELATTRADLAYRLPVWAFFGGLAGGLIAALSKLLG